MAMRSMRLKVLVPTLLAFVVSASLLHAAVTPGDPPRDGPGVGSLAGQLLIAAPDMPDPRFAHTVVLIVRHDRNGAFGIVINRPVEERPLSSLLEALGDTDTKVDG